MVQVDVFWGYGWGAALAAAGAKRLVEEKRPFASWFFVATLLFLSLFWAPTGMLLLLRHPSWETMQAAPDFLSMPPFLVLGFGITNVTQGMLGFAVGFWLLRGGREYLAQWNWLLGYYGMFFILLYGWDGLGYDRFLYDRDMLPGSPAWAPGAGTGATWAGGFAALGRFFSSSVAMTLYTDGVWLLPPFYYWLVKWRRENGVGTSGAALVGKNLAGVFLVGVGCAAASALTVHYVGRYFGVPPHVERSAGADPHTVEHIASYFVGLPLSWATLYLVLFKPGRLGHRFIMASMA